MGRAARRKKLNANYGNLISLRTEKAISQHAAQIIRDLFAECKEIVKNAMAGTTESENYQSELAKIKLGLENRLSAYRESNRQDLIREILTVMVNLSSQVVKNKQGNLQPISPMLIFYIIQASEKYLTSEQRKTLLTGIKELVEQEPKIRKKSGSEWMYEKVTEEIQLLENN